MKVLFVCVGNSCRSQMAEGLAREMGFDASSAGTHPADEVAINAKRFLEGRGIDTSELTPKSVDQFKAEDFDKVISMGCGVHCPVMRIDEDWELEDPVGQAYEVYEATAAEIERHVLNIEHIVRQKLFSSCLRTNFSQKYNRLQLNQI